MEYRDYETDKIISREQYIANGLERGELLYKYECGCVIIQDRTADAYIVYCHKHASAPDLYEACNTFQVALMIWQQDPSKAPNTLVTIFQETIGKAIAKVEGKAP